MQKVSEEFGLGGDARPLVRILDAIQKKDKSSATGFHQRGLNRVAIASFMLDASEKAWDGRIEDGIAPEAFDGAVREDHGIEPGKGGLPTGALFSHEIMHGIHASIVEKLSLARSRANMDGSSSEQLVALSEKLNTFAGFYGEGIGGTGFYDTSRSYGYWWGKLQAAGYAIPKGVNLVKFTNSLRAEMGKYGARYPWEFLAEAYAIQSEGGTLGKASALLWKELGLPAPEPAVVGTDRAGLPSSAEKVKGRASRTQFSALDLLDNQKATSKAFTTKYSWQDRPDQSDKFRAKAAKHVSVDPDAFSEAYAEEIRNGQAFKNRAIAQGIVRAKKDGMKAEIFITKPGGDGLQANVKDLTEVYNPHAEQSPRMKATSGDASVYAIDLDGTGSRMLVTGKGKIILSLTGIVGRGEYDKRKQGRLLGHEAEANRWGSVRGSLGDGYGVMHAGDAMAAVASSSNQAAQDAMQAHIKFKRLQGRSNINAVPVSEYEEIFDSVGGKGSYAAYQDWSRQGKGFNSSDPVAAMASTYAYAKMQGFVPTQIRKIYQRVMGPDAPPIPKWSPKR